jgi:pimeloyl-ACP methyl ester carboxylesterase
MSMVPRSTPPVTREGSTCSTPGVRAKVASATGDAWFDLTAMSPSASLARDDGATIAYRRTPGSIPGVVFLGGFKSDMTGTKATALEAHCRRSGRAFVRFDYGGHGESSGRFEDGTIGRWTADALAVIDQITDGSQVLVGSSMGGWIALLCALARPARIGGVVGVAAAPDFTEELMWARFSPEARRALETDGVWREPSEYDEDGYPITVGLIEEGRKHLLLDRAAIAIHVPVRLVHGMKDMSVPWSTAPRIASLLLTEDVRVKLIKDGDHRLSREQDLAILFDTVDELCDKAA